MFAPVYMDFNATTALDPAVREAMSPWWQGGLGNPSSRHEYGRAARRAVDEARQRVAAAVGAHPTEIIFTGGGSEANNLFLKGAAACRQPGLLAVSAMEHPSLFNPARQLAAQGWRLRPLAADGAGRVDEEDFAAALAEKPALISLMAANNETGVLQPVAEWAARAQALGGGWFHTDAVQALGKIPLDFRALNAAGVHAMTLSAHKIHGPQGAGALVVDKRVELQPLIAGGGQERGLRGGTENVAALVGFGVACELAASRQKAGAVSLAALRSKLEAALDGLGAVIFGGSAERLPNTSYFAFPGIDGETLVSLLDRAGFAVASGAACASANPEPSHVLRAMGVLPDLARGAVRVSLGAASEEGHIEQFIHALQGTLGRLRGLTALAA